jgi:glycosyltransferase involved in cell wall biosynthesis
MSKGTLAMVTPSFYPMIGGIEFYVRRMGEELTNLGYDVHVYTPDSVFGKKMPEKEEEIDGVHVHRLHVWLDASYRLKLWPGLREALVRDHHDLIHVYSHDSYARPAASAAKETGAPLLITTYGPFETHSNYGPIQRFLFKTYDAFVTPSLFKVCTNVLVRYPEVAKWAASRGLSDSKIRLEPSGIPKEYLRKADGRAFRDKIGHDGELILYLGRVSPQKGVQYAVEAMQHVKRRIPGAKLVIAGPDYTGYSDKLRKLAELLGVDDCVVHLGAIEDEGEEREAISACDVFIMPSSFEGFSQAVMKAMAQQKPVIVSDVGGLPYEIDYGRCGLACGFGDPEMLADGLISLLESPEQSSIMGNNGRIRAEEFTFDRLAMNLSRVYGSAIES